MRYTNHVISANLIINRVKARTRARACTSHGSAGHFNFGKRAFRENVHGLICSVTVRNRCHPSLSHFAPPHSRRFAMRAATKRERPRADTLRHVCDSRYGNERRAWRAAMKRRGARMQPPGTCYTAVTNLVTVRCAHAAIKPLATMTARIVSELLACHRVPRLRNRFMQPFASFSEPHLQTDHYHRSMIWNQNMCIFKFWSYFFLYDYRTINAKYRYFSSYRE